MRNISNKKRRESQNTILCSATLFRKSRRLWDNTENIF